MEQFAKETLPVSLEEEMRRSYLDYAMSVIVGRALPDVRDGLKPVHRRVLFAMHEANNVWNRPYVKCARVVGEVLGNTIARRLGHLRGAGAHGPGLLDALSADRRAGKLRIDRRRLGRGLPVYECRLDRIRVRNTLRYREGKPSISFRTTTAKEREPTALPTKVPNLLINGFLWDRVGMATNIPPHNLGEVVDACQALLKKPETTIDDLIKLMPAPDFPTAGIIYGVSGVREGIPHRPRPHHHARADALRGSGEGQPAGDHHRRAALPGQQAESARAHRGARQRQEIEGIAHIRTNRTSPECGRCSS